MNAETITFICHLAYKFPPLRIVVKDYIEAYGGEILPHILMSEYALFISSLQEKEDWAQSFLEYLESTFNSNEDDNVSNLIAVSFIENLPFDGEKTHWSIGVLGGSMKKYYYRVYPALPD